MRQCASCSGDVPARRTRSRPATRAPMRASGNDCAGTIANAQAPGRCDPSSSSRPNTTWGLTRRRHLHSVPSPGPMRPPDEDLTRRHPARVELHRTMRAAAPHLRTQRHVWSDQCRWLGEFQSRSFGIGAPMRRRRYTRAYWMAGPGEPQSAPPHPPRSRSRPPTTDPSCCEPNV